MRVNSEAEMLKFGTDFAKSLTLPAVVELTGDVGSGKTTFTRGLSEGLGISDPITSPSFTISKRYNFPLLPECCKNYNNIIQKFNYGELIHYDFYRLSDPGIMRDELFDTLDQPNTVVVVEWGSGFKDLLPESRYRLEISQIDSQVRELQIFHQGRNITNMWENCGKRSESCGKNVQKTQNTCGKSTATNEK